MIIQNSDEIIHLEHQIIISSSIKSMCNDINILILKMLRDDKRHVALEIGPLPNCQRQYRKVLILLVIEIWSCEVENRMTYAIINSTMLTVRQNAMRLIF